MNLQEDIHRIKEVRCKYRWNNKLALTQKVGVFNYKDIYNKTKL